MGIKTQICCDNCGLDRIIDSSYPATYTLELKSINTGINTSGARYAVMVSPPIDGTLHFCNVQCLLGYFK